MPSLTRREVLKILSMAIPAAFLGCPDRDHFDEERVCVHVFNPTITLPEPLFQRAKEMPARKIQGNFFQIGIPELILCITSHPFLDIFQYFWPLSRKEFRQWQKPASIIFKLSEIKGKEDINAFNEYLEKHKDFLESRIAEKALILTFNEYTKYWIADLVETWQKEGIAELIIFKDPTRAPYLCDYPALQKGFKRPPP